MISLCLLLLALVNAKCSHKDFAMCSSNSCAVSYDYLLLVETWPGQFCHSKCCDLPKTTMALKPGFTLHGWWPNFVSGYPSCCKSPYTDAQVSKMIENDPEFMEALSYNWASLSKCKFFNYEYDKHGTCVSDVYNGATGPKDYAMTAIKMLNDHDFWKVFKAAGVVADGKTSYKKSWLKELAAKELGVEGAVYFTCSGRYLSELRACTMVTTSTKANPQFITCPSGATKQETCGNDIIFEKEPVLTDGGCLY
ncbi:hypothetical protein ENUP19_0011G0047 [Entamoeba nuttalli]|uniref:Uncharacterized protein n=1 Tax=Entamoeba nuttalli TaxID=412467 RepID=A0ABQ0D8P6_9EUKA